MKNIWNISKNIAAVLGVLAVLFGFTSKGYEIYHEVFSRVFTSVEMRQESEKFHNHVSYDVWDRQNLFDSIEKSNEAQWRERTEKRMDSFMGFIKLSIRLQDRTLKKTDTVKRNVEHVLDDVH